MHQQKLEDMERKHQSTVDYYEDRIKKLISDSQNKLDATISQFETQIQVKNCNNLIIIFLGIKN